MIVGHIGGGAVGGGYEIEKSLRLRAAAGAFLSRSVTQASSSQTRQHIRLCHKRGNLGAARTTLYYQGDSGGSGNMLIIEMVSDSIRVWLDGFGTYGLLTTAKYRDPSAHMDIYVGVDTGNATASDRLILVVNGVRVTGFQTASYPPLNFALNNGAGTVEYIGGFGASLNTDGYFSECFRADGASGISASSFGEFNADGVWVPKKYTGTYGTNGFYLPFNDGTNLTELCRDRSDNGNHWTANNISLTAGATYDWMDDTPTNNFAVLNPLKRSSANAALAEGNLRFAGESGSWADAIYGTLGVSGGRFKCEYDGAYIVGVNNQDINPTTDQTAGRVIYHGETGQISVGATVVQSGLPTSGASDTVTTLIDLDSGQITFKKNNVVLGVPVGIGAGVWFPFVQNPTSYFTYANFGQRPFKYSDVGFKALCTKNRPSVTITDPSQHHTVITTTKSGDTNFTLPWDATEYDTLFWIKRRDASGDWYQIDGLRGYDKILKSNSTAAETTDTNVLGVSGTTCTLKSTLPNGTYVIYAWKAGRVTERQTNTDGSITSTVSANVSAGFSIVTYTGTGANTSVGHGLGNVPRMITHKARAVSSHWAVVPGNADLFGGSYILRLNTTDARIANSNYYTSYPNGSLFYLSTNSDVNTVGGVVAYCHAEIPGYSKFGSYTGNGSTDGPFVWGDVSVMDVLVKRSDSFGDWVVWDAARSPDNVANEYVYPHLPNTEATSGADVDILSSGFKMRQTTYNANGGTYIYAAYAKHPFGAENVSPAPAR